MKEYKIKEYKRIASLKLIDMFGKEWVSENSRNLSSIFQDKGDSVEIKFIQNEYLCSEEELISKNSIFESKVRISFIINKKDKTCRVLSDTIVTGKLRDKIKARILECCTLFAFEYEGKEYHVDPFSENDFCVYTDVYGDQNMFEMSDIEDVMGTPYIDGKSLNEVADYIEILDW